MLVKESDALSIRTEIRKAAPMMRGKKVWLFGCTAFAETICQVLKKEGIRPFAFIDNNRAKQGSSCMGLEVFSPDRLLRDPEETNIIIICSKYHNEMKGQLRKIGCSEEQIFDIPVDEGGASVSDSKEAFEAAVLLVRKGYELYQSLYREGARLLLCPYPGTGDVYMACACLKAFLDKQQLTEYQLLVIGEKCRRVAELFGVKSVGVITATESDLLLKAWEFLGSEMVDMKPLLYWGWRTKRYIHADRLKQITFRENFLFDAFGFNRDVGLDKPVTGVNDKEFEETVKLYDIKMSKSVILAPYAGSFLSHIDGEEWAELSRNLVHRGYSVYTNCAGEEQCIPGTRQIFFPYGMAIRVMEYAGMFIGVRSGLCEIISSADCKQIILYESGFAASDYEYFSIRKMGLNDAAIELIYEKNKSVLTELIEPYIGDSDQ